MSAELENEKVTQPADVEGDELDLKSLIQHSKEAISRAASEVLAERESGTLLATSHTNHSSHSSSSTW